jgi:hypothetical protein
MSVVPGRPPLNTDPEPARAVAINVLVGNGVVEVPSAVVMAGTRPTADTPEIAVSPFAADKAIVDEPSTRIAVAEVTPD